MEWNRHSRIEGMHAFLGASKYSWLNYDEEKLRQTYDNFQNTVLGTRKHAIAAELIDLGIKLPNNQKTLSRYVNDAIGFKMKPEQPLFYSENCFGTADAISFRNDTLRIHDLKTGVSPVSMKQLYIYAALFCLEYGYDPIDIRIELRIYQNNNITVERPDPEIIVDVMAKIKWADEILNDMKANAKE